MRFINSHKSVERSPPEIPNKQKMKSSTALWYAAMMAVLLIYVSELAITEATVKPQFVTCQSRRSRCFLKHVKCPAECPTVKPNNPHAKACYLDCYSPKCEAVCKNRKPNCNGMGAACYDPRFIGGDGVVFYFHGKRDEHFALISDSDLQINARFIGLRPAGRTRDYTWIQALGLAFGSHKFSLEATRTEKWDDDTDHLRFSYDSEAMQLPEGDHSDWISPEGTVRLERTGDKNSVSLTVEDVVEISVNVVPITEKENRIHIYQIPANESLAHLEVQFRFLALSPKVEGVLGQTYRPDFENPAKPGVEMAVIGGDNRYKTSTLLSTDCASCIFHANTETEGGWPGTLPSFDGTLKCASGLGSGYGMVCRK
ncbi:hypothetical protein SAY86_025845 [Trapa natans]|uniref:Uncharacterized protein n=1 Tax=Trapa natans TaxID=22666 RepID=A0AAN7KKQ3_TRANT|nr:hypothetical protein SAY86_025845 [Trapa natans]